MAAVDELCMCSYETDTHVCMCVRRKWQARDRCAQCLKGRHSLELRETLGDWLPVDDSESPSSPPKN
jgi:hypothetical protein